MERLGQTLHSHLKQRGKPFTLKTVCQVGIRLIELFEMLHSTGKVYNDLKLDNILVGDKDGSASSLCDIRLIDFGLCTGYLNSKGQHIKEVNKTPFSGNMILGSVNGMNFKSVSRRDDLISLTYLMVYMLTGSLRFLKYRHL